MYLGERQVGEMIREWQYYVDRLKLFRREMGVLGD